jgi:hypothetical protein
MLVLMRATVLLAVVLMPAVARAERPESWLFRATGAGFGYSWDRDVMCPVDGRMFVGGFELVKTVTPGLLVGAGTGIGFNALPAQGCDVDGSGLSFTIGFVIGPQLDFYPLDLGFHMTVNAGYSSIDQDDVAGHGVGATLGLGYDWMTVDGPEANLLLGVLAQVTAMRTTQGHNLVMPALLFTVGFAR